MRNSYLYLTLILVGLLLAAPGVQAGVYIELMDSATDFDWSEIPVDTTGTFVVKMDADVGDTVTMITHGFRIYSKHGAVWQTPTYAEGPDLATYLDFFFLSPIDMDGFNEDTIGIWAIAAMAPGVPDGYTGLELFRINTRLGSEAIGDTICIDSSFYPPSGVWMWEKAWTEPVIPSWGGPYCWAIVDSITCHADGDANNDGVALTVGDLTYLTDFINSCGPAPVPLYSCDLTGDGYVNAADVQLYEDYFIYGIGVFTNGYPVPCPCDPIPEPEPDTVGIFGMEHVSGGTVCLDTTGGVLTVSRISENMCDTLVDANGDTIIVIPPPVKGWGGPGDNKSNQSVSNLGDAGVVWSVEYDLDSTLDVGASLEAEVCGFVDGDSDQVIASVVETKQVDDSWALGVKTAATSYTVTAYLNGQQVWSEADIAVSIEWFHCGRLTSTSKGGRAAGDNKSNQSVSNLGDAGIVAIEYGPSDTVEWSWENHGVSGMPIDFLRIEGDVDGVVDVGDITYVVQYAMNMESYTIASESYGVDYKDLIITNLGNATIGVVDTTVEVTGCGSSGKDGMEAGADQTDGDWSYIAIVVANPDPSGTLEVGATIKASFSNHRIGFPPPEPIDPLGFSIEMTKSDASTWDLAVESDGSLYTIEAYRNDALVFSVDSVPDTTLGYIVETSKGILPVGFKGSSTGKPASIIAWQDPSGVEWTWAAHGVSALTVDAISITVEDFTTAGDSLASFSVTAANMPGFTILDIQTGTGGGCCLGIRGNVDGDGNDNIDISDLVYLVDYMFTGGPPPPCLEEADVDGSGGIDISDLVYLVDYMFTGGPAPVACPG